MWSYWPVRQWMQTHTHTCTHTSNVPFLLVLQVCVCESVHDLCRIKTASSPDTMLIYSSFYMFFCLFTHRNRLPFCISVFSCLFHYLSLFPLSPALLYLSSLSPTASYLLFSLKKKKPHCSDQHNLVNGDSLHQLPAVPLTSPNLLYDNQLQWLYWSIWYMFSL